MWFQHIVIEVDLGTREGTNYEESRSSFVEYASTQVSFFITFIYSFIHIIYWSEPITQIRFALDVKGLMALHCFPNISYNYCLYKDILQF